MKVLFLTQNLDRTSSNLRVVEDWLNALAQRMEAVTVLAFNVGEHQLRENIKIINVRSHGKVPRVALLFSFAVSMTRATVLKQYDVVLAHMVPMYALLALPWARLSRSPLALWYTSHGNSRLGRLAAHLVDVGMTASIESYPIGTDKVVAIGHGIDVSRYPLAVNTGNHPVIVMAGRITPLKQMHLAVEAMSHPLLRDHYLQPKLKIAGETFYEDDKLYLEDIHRVIEQKQLSERVEFVGGVPGEEMPEFYGGADVCLSLRSSSAMDKVGLEAMASGIPIVTNNCSYRGLLKDYESALMMQNDDVESLASQISRIINDEPAAREMGINLRDRVKAEHGIDRFADRVIDVLDAVSKT
tara:strand:- start:3552 stop:4619 length:1068 start_codon:yes stop_codon:yes gene_type:complete